MQILIAIAATSEAAANPSVVQKHLDSWTARLGRMKEKPQTAARKQRIVEAKARIKELKSALKAATKKTSTKVASPKLKKADAPIVKKKKVESIKAQIATHKGKSTSAKSEKTAKPAKTATPKARTPKAEYKDARKELDRNTLSPTRKALKDTFDKALKAHVDAKDTGNKKLIAAAKKKRDEAMEAMKAHTTENINRLNAAKKALNIK